MQRSPMLAPVGTIVAGPPFCSRKGKHTAAAVGVVSVALAGACAVGPSYLRPEVPALPVHRFFEGEEQAQSIADAPWWDVVQDPQLQVLIREAIANNLDLRTATARVAEARAQYGIARSFLLPEVGAAAGYSAQQVSRLSDPPRRVGDKTHQRWRVVVPVSWEIDLFGRMRRDSEAALASYLATEEGRRAAVVTLVADVASTYLYLREIDLQLEVARRTLQANEDTVRFYEKRLAGRLSSRLEVDRAVANRARTAVLLPQLELHLALAENALSLLLGRGPGPIERGPALTEQHVPPGIPVGIPAALLERRPDVLAAEQQLVAANASVGAAKALFFPTISLTGLLGTVSAELKNLLRADANVWQVSPSLFSPVFQGGRIRRSYDAAKARFEQAVAQYQKAALNSYREVSNALVSVEKLGEQRLELEDGVDALSDAGALARSRYEAGAASHLEVLDADQQLLDNELQLAQVRGEEMRAFVELYRALGGGWQPYAAASAPGTEPPTTPP